jgi:hypothetical protein
MGFRDFRVYNQALLAHQAWRLIHFPDSLCARLLKAKYFPAGHLLDTAFIQDVSASWQGVIHGLELLKKGAIWRIGSGSMVKIWRDNWVPRADSLKVSGMKERCRLKWVSQLIDPATRSWDEAIIHKYFYHHGAEAILPIKIPAKPTNDFVAWHFESNGVFTVKSAYRLGMQPKAQHLSRGQSSGEPDGERSIWNLIWKSPVPQKVRIFAWRLATDSLAVNANVHQRMQKVSPLCPVCCTEEESAHHSMVRCTLARGLRDGMHSVWALPDEKCFRLTGQNWLLLLLDGVSSSTRVKLLFLLWRTWHHRNNVVHGDGKASIAASVPFLQHYVVSFCPSALEPDRKGKGLALPLRTLDIPKEPGALPSWLLDGWRVVDDDDYSQAVGNPKRKV